MSTYQAIKELSEVVAGGDPVSQAFLASIDSTLDVPGFVDPGNSTDATIAPGGVFTGTWIDVTAYSEFTIVYNADVMGSLFMDVSTNGIDIDLSKPVSNVTVGVHTLVITAQYLRVRWQNGSIGQGHFRMATMLHRFKSKDLTSTASQVLSDKNDVAVSRAINLPLLDITRGIISDKYTIHFNGSNPDLGNSWEDIWALGGDYPFPTTASTIQVVSADLEDDVAGDGARVVTVLGLDGLGARIQEDVDLVGGTPGTSTATAQAFFRVNLARVKEVGTKNGANYGDLLIQATTGAITLAVITGQETPGTATYGSSITQLGIASVPAQQTAYIKAITVDSDGSKPASVHLYKAHSILNTVAPFSPRELIWANDNVEGMVDINFDSVLAIQGPADVWFRAQLNQPGAARLDFNVDVIVIDNTLN